MAKGGKQAARFHLPDGSQGLAADWSSQIAGLAGRAARGSEIDALTLARGLGRPVRQMEFLALGIHQQHVAELARIGLLVRVSRGCYHIWNVPPSEWGFLAAAAIRWPSAVICGPTAAAFYGLTEDDGGPVWLAVPRGRGRPRGTVSGRQVRVREWLPDRFTSGIDEIEVDGAKVRIVVAERAVAELRELGHRVHPDVSPAATLAYARAVGGAGMDALEAAFGKIMPQRGGEAA